jgi:hypothetical protein
MMANQSSGIGWQRGSKRRSQQASPTESSNDGSESKAGLEAMGSAVHRGSVLRDTGEAYGENIVFQALVLYHTTCCLFIVLLLPRTTPRTATSCYILPHQQHGRVYRRAAQEASQEQVGLGCQGLLAHADVHPK